MSDKVYRIKPLEWQDNSYLYGCPSFHTQTEFGRYRAHEIVEAFRSYLDGGAKCKWTSFFGPHDSDMGYADTIEEAKKACEEDWIERVKNVLEEVN